MKSLVKSKREPGIWMQDVPVPEYGVNDVLIKIKKTAICGTDILIYSWDDWAQATIPVPMAVGHEFYGEIVELGKEVKFECKEVSIKPMDTFGFDEHW
jgi:threonine 3-dehydrogenase